MTNYDYDPAKDSEAVTADEVDAMLTKLQTDLLDAQVRLGAVERFYPGLPAKAYAQFCQMLVSQSGLDKPGVTVTVSRPAWLCYHASHIARKFGLGRLEKMLFHSMIRLSPELKMQGWKNQPVQTEQNTRPPSSDLKETRPP